ncbi:hypothetical protein [Tenacibaculum soleae]|uniref:hypothetical protein n=1 Tax=Tenacibaculum soleae TaxID=447689 RepID=UPI0026E1D131|nr:hypothetical protein [Tenacibaculum soleae]MDO6813914.1 hypothetical protein [Tenacibaculum soleae]
MNTQILPNWCKKTGIVLYVIGALPSAYRGFMDGIHGNSFIRTEDLWHYDIILYLGLLIYFLSKEKIEDDYINKIRLESYQLTLLISIIISFITFIIFKDIKVYNSLFLESFLLIFLIIFWFKKRQY